jgi:ornithine cyclodeaminase
VVVDSWEINMLTAPFRAMVESGEFSRAQLHGEIQEIVAGTKPGRTSADERVLIATTGIVSQDVAIAHYLYESAKTKGSGIWLPAAR